jgi:uncharacterized protein YprB with RNaseH-like and TPR domain
MAAGELAKAIREVARRHAEAPHDAAVRGRPGAGPAAPANDAQAPAIRRGIAELLRGCRPSEPPVRVERCLETVLELPGARLVATARGDVVEIRRELVDLLPGEDVARDLHEGLRALASREPEEIYEGLRPAHGCRLEDLAVVDLETTGFWGCPVFLVGVLEEEEGRLVTRQILARDYPEEEAMLHAAAEVLGRRRLLVTFNGKSYDVPCFGERCATFGIRSPLRRKKHVDVLHTARRRWRNELPDCRLQTLERHVTFLTRQGDVPSAEIPAVYHDFAASGDPEALAPVLHHGRVDVITTARLFARLAADPPGPVRRRKRRSKAAPGREAAG